MLSNHGTFSPEHLVNTLVLTSRVLPVIENQAIKSDMLYYNW